MRVVWKAVDWAEQTVGSKAELLAAVMAATMDGRKADSKVAWMADPKAV